MTGHEFQALVSDTRACALTTETWVRLCMFIGDMSQTHSKCLANVGFISLQFHYVVCSLATAAAKLLQSCPTLCDPLDSSPPGSPVPGILQARTLEWVTISFSNAWKWSHSVVSDSSWPHGPQPIRLLHPWDFPGKSTGVGCHCSLEHALNTRFISSYHIIL